MSNVMDFINENSGGGNAETDGSVYLAEIGQKVVGTIVGTPRSVDTQFGPRLVIDIKTTEGTNCQKKVDGAPSPATVGETLTLWVKPGNAMAALKTAINDAGANGIGEGGTIAMKLVDREDVGKGNPLNKHKAQYTAPVVAVEDGEDLF